METSKTLIAILILALIVIAVAGIWTTVTKDTGSKVTVQKATAQGKLYVNVVKPVKDAGNIKLTIIK